MAAQGVADIRATEHVILGGVSSTLIVQPER